MNGYTDFARFYEALMEDAEYEKRAAYILEICKLFEHETGKTLDLACGTGSLSRELFKMGVDIFGVDGSEDMLCEATDKKYEEGIDIPYFQQEMQELELPMQIDTCVCTLDSLNHLTDIDAVQETFNRVGKYMNSGGLFIFDVNTVYKHREVLGNNNFVIEADDIFCAWQNYLCDDDVVEIDLDFFLKGEDGLYERFSESFEERAYSEEQLTKMLKNAGFEVEVVYGDLSFDSPAPNEERQIFVARKL